jgi:hypothetical protein
MRRDYREMMEEYDAHKLFGNLGQDHTDEKPED